MLFCKGVELGAAKPAQYRIAHGHDRCRARQSIEDRELPYNPPRLMEETIRWVSERETIVTLSRPSSTQ